MSDEILACWAALIAFVEDIHAPQDLSRPARFAGWAGRPDNDRSTT